DAVSNHFARRWRARGRVDHLDELIFASVSAPDVRLLVLANIVPFPAHGGIQLRILELLRRTARHHDVTLGCHSWVPDDDANARALAETGMRTITGRIKATPAIRHAWSACRFAASGRPPELALYQSGELRQRLRSLLATETFDLLQIEETLLTPYLSLLPPEA